MALLNGFSREDRAQIVKGKSWQEYPNGDSYANFLVKRCEECSELRH